MNFFSPCQEIASRRRFFPIFYSKIGDISDRNRPDIGARFSLKKSPLQKNRDFSVTLDLSGDICNTGGDVTLDYYYFGSSWIVAQRAAQQLGLETAPSASEVSARARVQP